MSRRGSLEVEGVQQRLTGSMNMTKILYICLLLLLLLLLLLTTTIMHVYDVCVSICMCMPWFACGSQWKYSKSQFFSSTMGLGIEFELSDLYGRCLPA